MLHMAIARARDGVDLSGWTQLDNVEFGYTDRNRAHGYLRAHAANRRPPGDTPRQLDRRPAVDAAHEPGEHALNAAAHAWRSSGCAVLTR